MGRSVSGADSEGDYSDESIAKAITDHQAEQQQQ